MVVEANFYEVLEQAKQARKKAYKAMKDFDEYFQNDNLVSLEFMRNGLPLLKKYSIGEGITCIRTPLTPILYVSLHSEKGSELEIHRHDCHEIIFVETGKMLDMKTGIETKEGEYYEIKENQKHHLFFVEESFCHVWFITEKQKAFFK